MTLRITELSLKHRKQNKCGVYKRFTKEANGTGSVTYTVTTKTSNSKRRGTEKMDEVFLELIRNLQGGAL